VRRAALGLLALLALASSCNPTLSARSAAPPGRTARLDEVHGFWGNIKSYRMELSQGVALAVTCHRGGPCERLTITSDDPDVAEARLASLGALEPSGRYNQATSAAVVVIGKSPGTTRLHLRSREGSRTIAVTVVAPPASATRAASRR
jgi:hypothetical protein